MSVVAWDGKTLAADKRASCGSLGVTTTKCRRVYRDGVTSLLAWTGDQDAGEMMARWFEEGADREKWPKCQDKDDTWCRLIVVNGLGAFFYERLPVEIRVEDSFMAWGSGRDFALGAMACGKSACEAVEVACKFDTGCGNGIDAIVLDAP